MNIHQPQQPHHININNEYSQQPRQSKISVPQGHNY